MLTYSYLQYFFFWFLYLSVLTDVSICLPVHLFVYLSVITPKGNEQISLIFPMWMGPDQGKK